MHLTAAHSPRPSMQHAAASIGAALLLAGLCHAQLSVESKSVDTAAGPCIVHIATIDLADPRIEIVVTQPAASETSAEALLTPTDAWARSNALDLAINANFFALLPDPGQTKAAPGYSAGRRADIIGLSVTDGVVVSPPRVVNGLGDPALVFLSGGGASIGPVGEQDVAQVIDGVAGIGASKSSDPAATLLVTDGIATAATSRVEPDARHPRTAAGVSADGRTLWLVVADGRQPGYSVGMTLPELADLFISLGADDALNLDGGGSSAFIYHAPSGAWTTNRPSGGSFRPVANHLGVRVRPAVEAAAPNTSPQKESTTSSDPR